MSSESTSLSYLIRVPATSANLGPGFDTLGLALTLYDEVKVTPNSSKKVSFTIHGIGETEVPKDETNLIAKSMLHVFSKLGYEFPGAELESWNNIPHGSGLGSSGAATVAGVLAAKAILADRINLNDDQLLELATDIEGHPDNVAPALFGGLTIAWLGDRGASFKKIMVHREVVPLVLVPETKMSTKLARSLQPDSVSHEDAIFNVSRSTLLIAALIQSPEFLFEATEDRLHQNYRAAAMPNTSELVANLRAENLPAVVSGAGPSVLVLVDDPAERQRAAEIAQNSKNETWQALMLAVDVKGATLEVLSET